LQNQDPALNQAAARLGQTMRETEDQLMRDMLAATASFINAVGGNNGKFVAVVKSSLMDLKPLLGNAKGNKAQAAKACSVNVASEKTYRNVRCGALNTVEIQ
jgi:hypothetical protein